MVTMMTTTTLDAAATAAAVEAPAMAVSC